jgi:hypothetical protein
MGGAVGVYTWRFEGGLQGATGERRVDGAHRSFDLYVLVEAEVQEDLPQMLLMGKVFTR